MPSRKSGQFINVATAGESFNAFVPEPLPPQPEMVWDDTLRALSEQAALALGRLDGVAGLLPHPGIFLYAYVRKEAVVSSQIPAKLKFISRAMYSTDGSGGVTTCSLWNSARSMRFGVYKSHKNETGDLSSLQLRHAICL
jgi:hypothetical protein